MKIPGISALHAVITPACVSLHGDEGMGAFREAIKRLRVEYARCLAGWKKQGQTPTFHLVLTVERPADVDAKENVLRFIVCAKCRLAMAATTQTRPPDKRLYECENCRYWRWDVDVVPSADDEESPR